MSADGDHGIRTGSADSSDLRFVDESETESRSRCNAPRTCAIRNSHPRPNLARSGIGARADWRDRLGANLGETRKPSRSRYKRARFSVRISSLNCTPSSYLNDAKASRGRARFFHAITKLQNCRSTQAIYGLSTARLPYLAETIQLLSARYLQSATWKQ